LVIVGRPNAGKSTLLNQLSGQDTAIVTDIAGTTRDILREKILINDIPIHVVDTAGLRSSDDIVELEGIRRAKQAMNDADLVIVLTDIEHSSEPELQQFLLEQEINRSVLTVINKIDTSSLKPKLAQDKIFISARSGDGIELLKKEILIKAGVKQQDSQGAYLARRRHLNALEMALDYLTKGLINIAEHNAGELLAEDLKQAHQSLGEITGEFSADDLLGQIFSSFCIGK